MRKQWLIMILLCGVGVGMGAHAHAAQRIVSLKPNITEILFAIGVGDRVVGVSSWCDYPARAQSLPAVADYLQPNVEKILTLHPDVVLTSTENSLRAPIDQLQRLGVLVEVLTFDTVAHTIAAIDTIGRIVNVTPAATQLAAQLRDAVAKFSTPTPRAKPSALLLVAHEPMIAAGPSSFLGELLTLSGANNVITARTPAYPRLSQERVHALHPDVTIDADPIEIFRPGPRLVDGIRLLRERIYRTSTQQSHQ